MLMRCISGSIFRGDVVKKGAILDITAPECDSAFVKANFVAVDPTGAGVSPAPSTPAAPVHQAQGTKNQAPVVAGLSRDQAIAKLRANGFAVKGNASNAALAELYNHAFANLAEATAQ